MVKFFFCASKDVDIKRRRIIFFIGTYLLMNTIKQQGVKDRKKYLNLI
jgi:hypothetical protein